MLKSTSNHREFWNLVKSMRYDVRNGQLTNVEVFLFTEKSVTGITYYRGTSKRKILFQLVLRPQQNRNGGNLKDTSHSC